MESTKVFIDLLRRLVRHEDVVVIQIGANDGRDELRPFILRRKWTGVLVEPIPSCFAKLQKNYAGTNIELENLAIHSECGKLRFRVAPPGQPNWLYGSSTADVVGRHFGKHENIDWLIEEVPCITLAELMRRYPFEHIDVLMIDTEGMDWIVLQQFDFTRYQPYAIKIEMGILKKADKRHVQDFLVDHGYTILINNWDIVAKREPIKLL